MPRRKFIRDDSSSSSSTSSSSSDSSSDESAQETRHAKRVRKAPPPSHSEDCHIQENPSHPQVGEAVAVPAALTSLIRQTLGEETVLEEDDGGSGPSIPAGPTNPPLAGMGLEGGEQFWAQIVAALKGAKESKRRKKLKPTFRTCKRMLKRLRKGTSNKRLKELNKMYSMDVEDDIDFRAPSLDFEMLLKCQAKLGPSIGKGVNEVEKVLYKVHQSMLPVFPVLAFLESLELKGEAGKAVKHAFELAGRAFYDVSDFRRKNILSIVGENCMQLIENRDVFNVLEHKNLFGASIIDKLLKSGRLLEALVSLDVGTKRKSGESGKDPRLRPYHATHLHQHQQQPRDGTQGSGYQGRFYSENFGGGGGTSRFGNGAGPPHQQTNVGAGPSHRQFDGGAGWINANHGFVIDCIYDLSLKPLAVSEECIGGRIKHFLKAWKLVSADPWILNVVRNGLELDFEAPPVMVKFPCNARMDFDQLSIGNKEVGALLQKGAAVKACKIGFVSSMFIIKKASGGFRPIINLKNLNCFLVYRHFKMEGLPTLKHLIKERDWMVKIDLRDAYLTVPVNENFHEFLQFLWAGEIFQFTSLCFGLASAPWAFTKLLKPVVTLLRTLGFRVVIYLDDLIVLNQCELGILEQYSFIGILLRVLGFVINEEKSVGTPSQVMEFLGLIVNTVTLSFRLPSKKVDSMVERCSRILSKRNVPLRVLASLLGDFTWASSAVPFARSHYREVQSLYINNSKFYKGELDTKVDLTDPVKSDLLWWISNLASCQGRPMFEAEPTLSICSDASLSGWGAVCEGVTTGMSWSDEEKNRHINELEMLGAFNALRAFAGSRRNCTIELRVDNTTAVAYVNKEGGTRSASLNNLALNVARWCEVRNIVLKAEHLPGVLNSVADRESRRGVDWSDWRLRPEVFQALSRVWRTSVDLFANPWNSQLAKFVSWKPQPQAWAVNAFTLSWTELEAYAFPPFSLIQECLTKIQRDRAIVVLICPLWPSQPWFASLLSLACDVPRILAPHPSLLRSVKGENHPLCSVPSFRLVAWKLSGIDTLNRGFRRRDNTNSAYDSSWRIWSDWCLGRSYDPLCSAIPVVASFLAEQSKSKAYSTVNIYRSALSSVLERVDGHPVGQHPKIVLLMKGIFNRRPPLAKYNSTWDVDVVLSYLRTQKNTSLSLGALAAKLATLLALATLFRASDLAAIGKKSIKFSTNRVSFSLTRPRKAQKSGALQSFSLERLSDEPLDPVECLKCYISKTEGFRKDSNSELLFISSVGQHNPVKSQTISNWIKSVLKVSGIDVGVFSSHSTRGAAASKAVAVGASLDSVLSAGHWASSSTFKKFYHREKEPEPSVAASVLIPDGD
ncbi:reverse transcriptase [Daphnia sinensis]|uniref:Reverse transcriptase n=1 Tax=Daphnia sinensis TaxID=1820382 RepID=A0AAD5KWP6_9CRUS|nr:reverse transcriptase [Daphnia sinensis]